MRGVLVLKTLFLFGRGYAVSTLLLCLELIVPGEISRVYVLSENHNEDEYAQYSLDFELVCVNDLVAGISASDIVLIVDDLAIPRQRIAELRELADCFSKSCFTIEEAWLFEAENKGTIEEGVFDNNSGPTVLFIVGSQYSQYMFTELTIRQNLKKHRLPFRQRLSSGAKQCFRAIYSIVVPQLIEDDIDTCTDSDCLNVAMWSGDPFEYSDNADMLAVYIHKTEPDCIVLCMNRTVSSCDKLFQQFILRYGFKLDAILQSNYYTYSYSTSMLNAVRARSVPESSLPEIIFVGGISAREALFSLICGKTRLPLGVSII